MRIVDLNTFDKNWVSKFEEVFKTGNILPDLFPNNKIKFKETETSYSTTINIPGFNKDHVNITLEDGLLSIIAKKVVVSDTDDAKTESFLVTMELSEDSDSDAIEATVKDGVLSLMIGKKEPAPKNIKNIEVK